MVKVVFRFFKGETVALFPDDPFKMSGPYCTSYGHIGQHSAADYNGIVRESRPATEAEIAPLREELKSIGYKLKERVRR